MRILQKLRTEILLIEDTHGRALAEQVLRAAAIAAPMIVASDEDGAPMAAEHPVFTRMREAVKPKLSYEDDGKIAVVPIKGVLERSPDVIDAVYFGVEDTEQILGLVESAANNPDVRGVLYKIDSPGGFVTGGPEVADAIKATAKRKPTMTWTGGMMASLAYWIGSQSESVVASRSALVGSIGTYQMHIDYSELYKAAGVKVEVIRNNEATYKAAGVMGTALTDEQRAHLQERTQAIHGGFAKAVKSARPELDSDNMRGQVFQGSEAKKIGMVDAIGDYSFALGMLRSAIRKRG